MKIDTPQVFNTANPSGGTSSQFVKGDGSLDGATYLTSVTAHNILSTTHGDTLADSVVAGDILIGNATPKWARLPKGADGKVLTMVSGAPAWATGGGGSQTPWTLDISGGGYSLTNDRKKTSAISSDPTITVASTGKTYVVDTSSGDVSIALPAYAAAGDIGSFYTFVKNGANKLTLTVTSGEYIADGNTSVYDDQTTEIWANITVQRINSTQYIITGGHGTWVTVSSS